MQDVFEYRVDFAIHVFKYAMMVLMMAIVWLAVQREGRAVMSEQETVSYFVFAAILYSLSNFHTWYIEDDIRLGTLSKYLLKPISAFRHYFSFESAIAVLETILKFAVMTPIILLFDLAPNIQLTNFLLFCLYLPIIFIFSFTLFNLINYLSFWISESYAIRWALMILFRFLEGLLVPLLFFPAWYQKLSWFLPFQHLAYTPIRLLQGNMSWQQGVWGIGTIIFWLLIINFFRQKVWNLGTKSYEAQGQ